jgi:hypothetical protein
LVSLAGLVSVRDASSAPKDAAVTRIADDAINNDYLSLHFTEAAKKLRSAIAQCQANACSPQVRARVNRDLGVVLIAGLNKVTEGKKAFVEAVKADPRVTLDKDLTTPAIEQAFQAARASAGAGAAPAPAAPAAASSAGGDIVHTPPSEQAILTPLPIYVELPSGVAANKVLLMYKAFGAPDWQKLELKKMGGGYGGEIPCQAVGSTTGDLSYYIQATDSEGDVIATNGTRKAPNKVPIQNEIAGDAPHLPGRPAPAKCKDKADCPPGFPGCSKKAGKAWGASCEKDRECGEGLACKSGTCETGEKSDSGDASSGRTCDTSNDCDAGEKCNADKVCESSGSQRKRIWVSFNIQQDISFVPAQKDVCGSPTNEAPNNITCIDEQNYPYAGIPEASSDDGSSGNEIKGGPRRSTTRLLFEVSYLVIPNLSLGARLGYVLNTQPGRSLAKFHGEARLSYWFGNDPFAKKGLRPFAAVLGGVGEVDDKFSAQVYETLCGPGTGDPNCTSPDSVNNGLVANPTLTVWRRGAKTFAGAAAGVMIPTAPNMGVLVELKAQSFFPNSAFTLSPSVGYALGF